MASLKAGSHALSEPHERVCITKAASWREFLLGQLGDSPDYVLAQRLDIHKSLLSRWLNGGAIPSRTMVLHLAPRLELKPETLERFLAPQRR